MTETTAPPVGAGFVRVMVPLTVVPPFAVAGVTTKLEIMGNAREIVNLWVKLTVPEVTVIVGE